jgi:hypothetical protein
MRDAPPDLVVKEREAYAEQQLGLGAGARCGVEPHRRIDANAGPFRVGDQLGFVGERHVPEAQHHVQAGVGAEHLHPVSHVLVERCDEGGAALAIVGPGATQVSIEVSVADEAGEGPLFEAARPGVGERFGGAEGIDEWWRDDQVAEAEGREQHLREGAGIDDALVTIESLQGFDGTDAVTELAVVVVLEDPCPGRSAQSSRARRRARVMMTPVGNWCDGVT